MGVQFSKKGSSKCLRPVMMLLIQQRIIGEKGGGRERKRENEQAQVQWHLREKQIDQKTIISYWALFIYFVNLVMEITCTKCKI